MTVNPLEVVGGSSVRASLGEAFSFAQWIPASVGQNAWVGIFNPAANVKSAYITRFGVVAGIAAAEITLISFIADPGMAVTASFNRMLGGAATTVKLESTVLGAPPAGATILGNVTAPGNSDVYEIVPPDADPIIVPPGHGFFVNPVTSNMGLEAVIDWYER